MGFQREQTGLDRTEPIQESKGHEASRGGGNGGQVERVGNNGRFHTGSASHYSCPGTKTMGTDRGEA